MVLKPVCVCVRVVEFASHSDMKNAIEKLNGTELNGRKLKLYEDRKRRYELSLTCTPVQVILCVITAV